MGIPALAHSHSKNNQVDTVLLILSILFGPCKRMICPNIVRGHWEGLHGGCTEGGGGFFSGSGSGSSSSSSGGRFLGGTVESSSLLGNVGGVSSSSSTSSTSPRGISSPTGKRGMLANDKIILMPHTLFLPSLLRRLVPLSSTSPKL